MPASTVVTDPAAYPELLAAVRAGGFTLEARRRLAASAFAHTAAYDTAVSSWFASVYAPDETANETGWPTVVGASGGAGRSCATARTRISGRRFTSQRTGPAWRRPGSCTASRCRTTTTSMPTPRGVPPGTSRSPCVAIIKHTNPCGIAVGADIADAHRKAHACDPLSAFGGIIASNRPVTEALASQIAEVLTEVVVAPASTTRRSTCSPPRRTCGCCGARRPGAGAWSGGRLPGVC